MANRAIVVYLIVYIGCVYVSAVCIENAVKHLQTSLYVYKTFLEKKKEKDVLQSEVLKIQAENEFLRKIGTGETKVVYLETSQSFAPKGFFDSMEKPSKRSQLKQSILDFVLFKL